MSSPEGATVWIPVIAAAVGALVKGGFDLYMARLQHKAPCRPAYRRGKKCVPRQE